MKKMVSKPVAHVLILSFLLFTTPFTFATESKADTCNLIGFVYAQDGVTPVQDAVAQVRNVFTGKTFKSTTTDKLGVFKFQGIDAGLYVMGITAKEGNYNVEKMLGIEANETAKVSISLGQEEQEEEECPRGESYVPEVQGECDEGYEWNPDTGRCECKKKKKAFFATPLGIGTIIVAAGAVGVVTYLLVKEDESPKK